jgi:hypothetical protein
MTIPPVNISFRCTELDYVRGQRAHLALHIDIGKDIVALPLIGIFGAFFWHIKSSPLHWIGAALIGLSVLGAVYLCTIFLILPPLSFRRELKAREDVVFTFTPESIHFKSKDVDSQLQWSTFSKALIDSHSYLLYFGKNTFALIPKRVLQDEERQKAFEQLLSRQIPKIIRR